MAIIYLLLFVFLCCLSNAVVVVVHVAFLFIYSPGNAAIILTAKAEKIDPKTKCPIAPIGHYTCAWKEDMEEEGGYFYFDSNISKVNYIYKSQRGQYPRTPFFPFQPVDQTRVLFIFKLPLEFEQRQAAINFAIANLGARLNRILEHCLWLKDHDITLPVDFFAHL